MLITSLKLKNFRNYEHFNIEFDPRLNLILGQNGQGKTNIVEAISVATYSKSFRTKNDFDMIRFDQEYYKIHLAAISDAGETEVSVIGLKNKKKQIKVNDIALQKSIDLIGRLRSVIFSYDDLKLLRGNPQDRRHLIDRSISLVNYKYKYNLLKYHKNLKQRNQLLKDLKTNKSLMDTLDVWDQQLSEIGSYIVVERLKYIANISKKIEGIHSFLSSESEQVTLSYESFWRIEGNISQEEVKALIYTKFKESLKKDIYYGTTSAGPHRDDLAFEINGNDARKYASQGQQRTIIIAYKIAEIEILAHEFKDYPILLLDDVMSELDTTRQTKLLKLTQSCQTILTTTDLSGISLNDIKTYRYFEINAGALVNHGGADEYSQQ